MAFIWGVMKGFGGFHQGEQKKMASFIILNEAGQGLSSFMPKALEIR